jgi:1-deoxy-D-xylulose-5-phosphate synthase
VAEECDATLVNMRFVKPLDKKTLNDLAKVHDVFVTAEDNAIIGGAGSTVGEYVLDENLGVRVKILGLPDKFLEHGTREEILTDAGLSQKEIMQCIKKI